MPDEIIETFRAITQQWVTELRQWDTERLTVHPFVSNHVGYDVPTTARHPLPGH